MASTDTVAGATLLKHRHHHTKDHIADVLKTHSEDLSNCKASPWQPPRTPLHCGGDFCMGKHSQNVDLVSNRMLTEDIKDSL